MEYCGGGTLRDLIERHKAARSHLNEEQVRTVLLDMALAMQCLQNQNPKIIHRDLKPDNLLLVDAAKFNVKLADFTLVLASSQHRFVTPYADCSPLRLGAASVRRVAVDELLRGHTPIHGP